MRIKKKPVENQRSDTKTYIEKIRKKGYTQVNKYTAPVKKKPQQINQPVDNCNMFQSLASYFYGTTSDTSELTTTSSDNQQDDPTVDVLTKPAATANIVAKPLINNDNATGAEDIDSDWLIVDKDGKLI